MRYHLTPARVATIKKKKKPTNNKCCRGYGEKTTLFHCWWEHKLILSLWRTKKLGIEVQYDAVIPLLDIRPEKTLPCVK